MIQLYRSTVCCLVCIVYYRIESSARKQIKSHCFTEHAKRSLSRLIGKVMATSFFFWSKRKHILKIKMAKIHSVFLSVLLISWSWHHRISSCSSCYWGSRVSQNKATLLVLSEMSCLKKDENGSCLYQTASIRCLAVNIVRNESKCHFCI